MISKVYQDTTAFWHIVDSILNEEIEEDWELTHLQNFTDALDQYHPNGEKEQGKAPKTIVIQGLRTLMCVAYARGRLSNGTD